MTEEPGRAPILATLTPRPARRWLGVAIQAVLGLLLIAVGAELWTEAPLWGGLVAAGGMLALWGGRGLHAATAARIELTDTELRDSDGRRIALLDEIRSVERGALAFKPSNGFLLRLARPAPRTWRPGLWWRLGRTVGVGGTTPGHEGRAMAELIALKLAERR